VPLTSDGSNINSVADLVELDADRDSVQVLDASTSPSTARPSSDDTYQLVTYAYRLGLTRAALVYPGRCEHGELVIGEYCLATVDLPVLVTHQDVTNALEAADIRTGTLRALQRGVGGLSPGHAVPHLILAVVGARR
jgi:hypothetical protein